MHQTTKTYLERQHSIPLSVTRTLYVYQVCHGVGRCVKDGSCSSSNLEWKSTDSINGISAPQIQYVCWHCARYKCSYYYYYLTISTNVRRYQTHHRWHFFSFRKTAHWCTCIVCATQSNCCGSLDFLSLKPCPNSLSWTHWIQNLGSHRAAWVWIVSQKDWRNQGATGWIVAMHWYSIWVKKCDFRVSPFYQVVQKHRLFEVA